MVGLKSSVFWTVLFVFWCFFGWQAQLSQVPEVKIVACDIGQGDAFLVTYAHLAILVDTGPNSAVLRCLQAELPPWKKTIEMVVLTHADSDHIGGFSAVSERYRIGLVLMNPKLKTTQTAQEVARHLQRVDKIMQPSGGEQFSAPGMRLRVVWSEKLHDKIFGKSTDDGQANPDSIGIFLETSSFGFLSLGDLECTQELAVAGGGLLGKTSVLKVSHHGSKFSSCPQFLQKIAPEVALISVGAGNRYGHPAPNVLENLRNVGIPYLRTDQMGRVTLQAKEGGISIFTEKGNSLVSR